MTQDLQSRCAPHDIRSENGPVAPPAAGPCTLCIAPETSKQKHLGPTLTKAGYKPLPTADNTWEGFICLVIYLYVQISQ